MAQPFNYTLNVPNPAEAVAAGLQQGVNLASIMERTDALAAQKQQTLLENQALQAKAQRLQDFQGELGKLSAEGFTAKGLNELMIRYPEAAKQLEAQYTNLGTQERQARVDALLPVAAAVNAGDSVSAQLVLRDQIEALTNSGKTDEAKAASRMLDLITTNPAAAKSTLNLATAGAMGMDKYADTLVKFEGSRREEELQPSKVREAAGKAEEAETKGRFAEKKIKGEISRDLAAAFASSASAKKSLAEAKTEDEKRSAAVDLLVAQASLVRSKIEKAMGNPEDARQGALATIDVIDKVLKNEGDARSILGTWNAIPKTFNMKGLEGIKLGAWKPQIAMSEKELDVLANINELGGKTFLQQAQKMRGLGQLTEMEGKKIVEAAGNLSREQSPDRFMATLKTMREALAAGAARKPGAVPSGELIFGGSTQGGGQESGVAGMSDDALKKALGL
jgi:hypothetical protein